MRQCFKVVVLYSHGNREVRVNLNLLEFSKVLVEIHDKIVLLKGGGTAYIKFNNTIGIPTTTVSSRDYEVTMDPH